MSKKAGGPEGQTVKVMLRVRPLVKREIQANHTTKRIAYNSKTEIAIESANDRGKKTFNFHEVFPPGTSNNHVYSSFAEDTVDAAFQGYHGVMFVYGQTASGKTHTISNNEEGQLGMLQQSMFQVWDRIQNDTTSTYNCTLTYVEIYMEHVTDLLADKDKDRAVRLQTANLGEVIMLNDATGKTIGIPVQSYQDCMKYFEKGQNVKAIASTSMNDRSSRSHTIFTLDIEKSTKVVDPQGGATKSLTATKGRLVLCDLAGSERVSKTKAEGNILKEAAHINGSLLVLGNVVKALTDKKVQHAPFRESRLTRILQYSLSGHGKTSLVVTISPSDDNIEESISAIGFGQRAIQIKQVAQKHEIRDYQALYLALQSELDRRVDDGIEGAIAEERRSSEEKIIGYTSKIKVLEAENALLQAENIDLRKGNPVHRDPSADLTKKKSDKELLKAAADTKKFNSDELSDIIKGLAAEVKLKDSSLQQAFAERHALTARLKSEESKLFSLGLRYRDLIEESVVARREKDTEIAELQKQVSVCQGTEYLAPTLPDQEGDMKAALDRDRTEQQQEPPLSPSAMSSPSTVGFGVSSRVLEELNKSQTENSALKQDIAELEVYQKMASDAIRMLFHDNQRLGGTIGKVKK